MKRLAAIYGGCHQHYRSMHEPKYRGWFSQIVYLRDLAETDLSQFDGIWLTERLHRRLLLERTKQIKAYLTAGGTVIAFGEQPDPWLPGVLWEHRPTNFWWWREGAPSGLTVASPEHPLFERMTLDDATWHQHGVFWPADGAETLIAADDGAAVLYVDRVSTAGTLIATTLDPMFHYGSFFMPATERFLDKFLPWVVEEML